MIPLWARLYIRAYAFLAVLPLKVKLLRKRADVIYLRLRLALLIARGIHKPL